MDRPTTRPATAVTGGARTLATVRRGVVDATGHERGAATAEQPRGARR